MGLAETQRLLAHLYTDNDLRERFFHDPEGVGRDWGLSAGERETMRGLHADQTRLFAHSLQAKRLGEVRKLLPQTSRALGPHAVPLFRRFADQSLPTGIHKHRADALGFAAFLPSVLHEEPPLPLWLPDVLRYEAGWLTAGEPACRWHVCRTRRDILAVLHAIEGGSTPPAFSQPALALWWRLFAGGPLHHIVGGIWAGLRQNNGVRGAHDEA